MGCAEEQCTGGQGGNGSSSNANVCSATSVAPAASAPDVAGQQSLTGGIDDVTRFSSGYCGSDTVNGYPPMPNASSTPAPSSLRLEGPALESSCLPVCAEDFGALHDVIDAVPKSRTAAVDDRNGTISYEELSRSSFHVATVLRQRGLKLHQKQPVATCMHRECRWLTLYVASMRCGVPIVPLGGDNKDLEVELRRNKDVLEQLTPQMLIYGEVQLQDALRALVEDAREAGIPTFDMDELRRAAAEVTVDVTGWPVVQKETTLAYVFTGGTTKASKAVPVTHGMAVHEWRTYRELFPAELHDGGMRFLQNSSAFWGAAFLGQLNVAFAMGGTAVMCEGSLPHEIKSVIDRFQITCFGAVPFVLMHLEPEQVPTVKCVISWADYLPNDCAAKWREKMPLRDLLIASEYWLAFYCTFEQGRALQPVSGVEIQILAPDGVEPVQGENVGELCLSGDTVFLGYADPANDEGRFVDIGGRRFFRTRDQVKWIEPGKTLQYCGRCDDMVKVGGKWFDINDLEAQLSEIDGVKQAKLISSAVRHHAFFILGHAAAAPPPKGTQQGWRSTLEAVHKQLQKLDKDVAVHLVAADSFPVNPTTGKVDRKKLLESVQAEDVEEVVGPRRECLLGRFAKAQACAVKFCNGDSKRMVCLAYIWYAVFFCKEHTEIRVLLDNAFALQGGAKGTLLALAKSLPRQQLLELAKPGAAHARQAGRDLDWVIVFWSALPHWLPNKAEDIYGPWTPDIEKIVAETVTSLQVTGYQTAYRTCKSCSFAVTLHPSVEHCCVGCQSSNGTAHDEKCLKQPIDGWRKCDCCDFACTFLPRHCCHACRMGKAHGPKCEQKPFFQEQQADVTQADGQVSSEVEGKPCHQDQRVDGWQEDGVVASATGKGGPEVAEGKLSLCATDDLDEQVAINTEAVTAVVANILGSEWLDNGGGDLSNLNSLKAMNLSSAVRQSLGRDLPVESILACADIAQLTVRVEGADQVSLQSFPDPGPAGFRLWTFGWSNAVQWVFECDKHLSVEFLRTVVPTLMHRHPALRLCLREHPENETRFMEAAMMLDLWRTSRGVVAKAAPKVHALIPALQTAMQVCWPRWHTPPIEANANRGRKTFLVANCNRSEVNQEARRLKKNFRPPFQLALLQHPETDDAAGDAAPNGGMPKCHLVVMLSHAIADGSAILPLARDLSQLCQYGEGSLKKRRDPHFGAALEDRLLRTLADEDFQGRMFLDKRIDVFGYHFPDGRHSGFGHSLQILPDEVEKFGATLNAHLNCPMELVLVSMIALTLARLNNKPRVKLTVVHHGRDHPPGAADVIGFFTDFRTLEVPTSELSSLLGVISYVHKSVVQRKWRLPKCLEKVENLINIVPSDFRQMGCLSQAAQNRQRSSSPTQVASWKTSVSRPLEFQIEQVNASEWDITMYMAEAVYVWGHGQQFRDIWLELLQELCESPLKSCSGALTGADSTR